MERALLRPMVRQLRVLLLHGSDQGNPLPQKHNPHRVIRDNHVAASAPHQDTWSVRQVFVSQSLLRHMESGFAD